MAADGGACDATFGVGVRQSTEQVVRWESFQWLHNAGSICGVNAAPFLSGGLICQHYTSNSVVTQIARSFSKSIPPDVGKTFLVFFRPLEMQIIHGEGEDGEDGGRGREGGEDRQKNEMLMWKYNETDERETEGRKRETRGNRGRQEGRHYSNDLRGFCLCGCDVTHRQSMF